MYTNIGKKQIDILNKICFLTELYFYIIIKLEVIMKIFAISDLHLSINNQKPMNIFGPVWEGYLNKIVEDWSNKVTNNDIVLLAGDLSWAMKLEEANLDFEYLKNLPGKKIIVRGNHDYWWSTITKVRNILPNNFYALQNDAIKFDNVIFCGTRGWMQEGDKNFTSEDKKIFDRELIRLEISLKEAKKFQTNNEQIVCLIHYPPFDKNFNGTKFTKLIEDYNVNTVIYGHLHGFLKNKKLKYVLNGVTYYLTSCDQTNNKLVEVILEEN